MKQEKKLKDQKSRLEEVSNYADLLASEKPNMRKILYRKALLEF